MVVLLGFSLGSVWCDTSSSLSFVLVVVVDEKDFVF